MRRELIHNAEDAYTVWLVHGPVGSVQFVYLAKPDHPFHIQQALDLGRHADAPQHDHEDAMACKYRPSGRCYYDGSSLSAGLMVRTFYREGEEAAWRALEACYRCVFEDGPWPWDGSWELALNYTGPQGGKIA
jgi:hypothetical protein